MWKNHVSDANPIQQRKRDNGRTLRQNHGQASRMETSLIQPVCQPLPLTKQNQILLLKRHGESPFALFVLQSFSQSQYNIQFFIVQFVFIYSLLY